MEVLGAIVGIVELATRTSSKLWELARDWKDAPEALYRLKDDITRVEAFLNEIHQGLRGIDDSRTEPHSVVGLQLDRDIKHLVEEAVTVLTQLEQLVDELFGQRKLDDTENCERMGKRRRIRWIQNAYIIVKHRQRLNMITTTICNRLISRNLCTTLRIMILMEESKKEIMSHTTQTLENRSHDIITFVDQRVRGMEEVMTSRLEHETEQAPRHETSNPPLASSVSESLTTRSGRSTFPHQTEHLISSCPPQYLCRCHALRYYSLKLAFLQEYLGSITLTYTGRWTNTTLCCSDPTCLYYPNATRGTRRSGRFRLFYTFPNWLVQISLAVFFSWRPNGGGPQTQIRVINQVPPNISRDPRSIFRCARRGDLGGVVASISQRQSSIHDVAVDGGGMSLVALAMTHMHLEVAAFLLRAGADLYQEGFSGGIESSAAGVAFQHFCSGRLSLTQVSQLIQVSSYIDCCNYSPLHLAILDMVNLDLTEALHHPSLRTFLDHKAEDSFTPLHIASLRGILSATVSLLRAGANPNSISSLGRSPLHIACDNSNYAIAKKLLDAGASLDLTDAQGCTPFLNAAGGSDMNPVPLISLLLDHTSKDTAANNNRNSNTLNPLLDTDNNNLGPLDYALWVGNLPAVQFLIHTAHARQTPITLHPDTYNDPPLSLATRVFPGHHADCTRFLMEIGGDTGYTTATGGGILHWLACVAQEEVIPVFVEYGSSLARSGVDPYKRDGEGKTPLMLFDEFHPQPELRGLFVELLRVVGRARGEIDGGGVGDDGGQRCLGVFEEGEGEGEEEEEFFDARERWA